jgi:hypothetical protein
MLRAGWGEFNPQDSNARPTAGRFAFRFGRHCERKRSNPPIDLPKAG